jgi:hypothetical protein
MDAANLRARTVAEYLAGTANFRTDLYSGPSSGTLLTHKESIELFKRLGVKMTPELKSPSVTMPFDGFSQQAYAQKLIDENVPVILHSERSERDAIAARFPRATALAKPCPPATLLYLASASLVGTGIATGAQDCHAEATGAFTGDISAPMIADSGATHVIVGHSERRTLHGETSEMVRAKAAAARVHLERWRIERNRRDDAREREPEDDE